MTQYCSECCSKEGSGAKLRPQKLGKKRDNTLKWRSNLLQLLDDVHGQNTSAALSLCQDVQIVARRGAAHAPIQPPQNSNLGQLELLSAHVKQSRIFPRIWDRAIDDELEALRKKNISSCGAETAEDDEPQGGPRPIALETCGEKAGLCKAEMRGCKLHTDAAAGLRWECDRRERRRGQQGVCGREETASAACLLQVSREMRDSREENTKRQRVEGKGRGRLKERMR